MQDISVDLKAKNIVRFIIIKILISQLISIAVLIICCVQISYLLMISIAWLPYGSYLYLFYSETKKISPILDTDCDPYLFTAVFKKLAKYSFFRNQKTYTALCISHGLSMSGDFEEADKILRHINLKGTYLYIILFYYSIYVNCAEAFHRFDEIESTHDKISEIIQKLKPTSRFYKMGEEILVKIEIVLTEYREDYNKALSLYKQYNHAAVFPIIKANFAARMGKLYFLTGDFIQAKECCEYGRNAFTTEKFSCQRNIHD